MKKLTTLFVAVTSLFLLFGLASPALADAVTDYNQRVAEAQTKIQDLQSQLDFAQSNLDSWLGDSNSQAVLLNNAQTVVTEATDSLDTAHTNYLANKADYDSQFSVVTYAEHVVSEAITAVNQAADLVDATYVSYVDAQSKADTAKTVLDTAQTNYDTQLINVGGQGTSSGLTVDIYKSINSKGNPPSKSDTAYTKCKTVTVTNINANWGGGDILGCGSDYVMLHYKGYITYPTTSKVYFQAPADDGFFMSINGTQIINDWSLKGCGANTTGLFSFTGGKSYAVDAWFYEWTGGACSSLNYKPLGSSSYSVVPGSMFTQDAVAEWVKDPELKAVLDAKTVLYVQAVSVELQADVVYTNACDSYDAANLTYGYLGADLAFKRNILQGLESVMSEAEIAWQTASDDKVYADADLLDLKTVYATTFDAIEQATLKVDGLEAQLLQAKQDLVNIPKPSAQEKRRSKKIVGKYFADGAYLARQKFVIDLK